jgi:hypothetical protein
MNRNVVVSGLAVVAAMALCSMASAVEPLVVEHSANLNWDVKNTTQQTVNDFEIVVETPNWQPPHLYLGSLGFPKAEVTTGDFVPGHPGLETKVRFYGRTFNPDEVAHVGAFLEGSGRVIDAYFTYTNGQGVSAKVGPSIPIVYEMTRVTRSTSPNGPRLDMRLWGVDEFFAQNPGYSLKMTGIRIFADIPSTMLTLEDLTTNLDLSTLSGYERTQANPPPTELVFTGAAQFYDVFVASSFIAGPDYSSLLTSNLYLVDPNRVVVPVGQFWNLNVQCPEPAGVVPMALAGLVVTRSRRR